MPRKADSLSDRAILNAKPKASPYRLADGNGLFLQIGIKGTKSWLVRYRLPDGRQPAPIVIGHYPDMSLAEARIAAVESHRQAAAGGAPSSKRAKAKMQGDVVAPDDTGYTFNAVSARWLADKRPSWQSETYRKARFVLDDYLLPKLGDQDMRTMATKDVKPVLVDMARSTPTLAKKARQYINAVVDYAIHDGMREDDKVLRLAGILPTAKPKHMPAVTDNTARLGELMRAIDAYPSRVTRAALKLAAFTALRPGIIASARWSEIDLDGAEWRIPGMNPDGTNRMKTGQDFTTSLPRQAVEALQEMHALTGADEYVFPPLAMQKTPHLSRDTLSKALREMGFQGEHTTHGFRATLRTLGRERLDIDIDVLEQQLAHAPKDEIQAAYARVKFRDKRREVMQNWADYLDGLKTV